MDSFKLTLPEEWVGRIVQLLSEHPYKQVSDIIDGLKRQVAQQVMENRMRQGPQQGVQAGAQNGAADVADTTTRTVQ